MTILAKLIGGRFDGESHAILYPADAIVVARDRDGRVRIGDIVDNPPPYPSHLGCETYELDERDEQTAVYRRLDLDGVLEWAAAFVRGVLQ